MLLRQNLRRRHESALVSGPLCRPQKRRRDKRFAAADIALQKARHPLAGRHIAQCLVRGAPLRSRRRKGESGIKLFNVRRRDTLAGHTLALCAQPLRGAGENEKFFKCQPPPRQSERFPIRRKMHVPVRKADLRQCMLLGDLRGQKLRQHIAAGIERALHGAHDELIRYTVRQPVGAAVSAP